MHELSLAEGIVRIVEGAARARRFTAVRCVRLEIGRLAQVEVDAMRFCFDAATRGSVAEGAALEVVDVPGRAWCLPCGDSVEIEARHQPCPRCGGYQLQVTAGTELRVLELDVDGIAGAVASRS
ncbi:MAG: hydrogenase maturation nickel metallochaperone HypA [Burkholderiales bacterium]